MPRITPRPIDRPVPSGSMLQLVDVDETGATMTGERFDTEPATYRDHARVENVVARYPDGSLKLVKRITPARQAV